MSDVSEGNLVTYLASDPRTDVYMPRFRSQLFAESRINFERKERERNRLTDHSKVHFAISSRGIFEVDPATVHALVTLPDFVYHKRGRIRGRPE